MPTDSRSDRSRVSPAVAGLIRQDRRDCDCWRVNSAEAETTRPTFGVTLPGDVWAVDQTADE